MNHTFCSGSKPLKLVTDMFGVVFNNNTKHCDDNKVNMYMTYMDAIWKNTYTFTLILLTFLKITFMCTLR